MGVKSQSDIERSFAQAARFWWIFLVIGAGWLLLAIIMFRFDWASVSAISILFGIVMIAAAIDEAFAAFAGERSPWARIFRAVLGVAFAIIGIVAFVHPGNTFAALAAVMSFYFILKGILNVALAFAVRNDAAGWWVQLLIGLAEMLIGFWAAGDFGHKTILLVVWVGAAALMRGISAIIFAFAVKDSRGVEQIAAA